MPKTYSFALFSFVLLFASHAGAGVTVDLLWLDTGTDRLEIDLTAGDPLDGLTGPGSGCGIGSPNGRCMKVLWTLDEPLFIGSNSVAFDPSSGLTAAFASFFNDYNSIVVPVGKSIDFFRGFPNPTVGVDNMDGIVGAFTGALTQIPPGDGTSGLPAGTYTVGTIIWDASGVSSGFFGSDLEISAILQTGIDGFLSPAIDPRTGQNVEILDITLNNAALRIIPEPGTAALLGLGLIGLVLSRRRGL